MKQLAATQTATTEIKVGSKVTFLGHLPGGFYDNYSGYSKIGSLFGTVVKVNPKSLDVQIKDRGVFRIAKAETTNIEDLF